MPHLPETKLQITKPEKFQASDQVTLWNREFVLYYLHLCFVDVDCRWSDQCLRNDAHLFIGNFHPAELEDCFLCFLQLIFLYLWKWPSWTFLNGQLFLLCSFSAVTTKNSTWPNYPNDGYLQFGFVIIFSEIEIFEGEETSFSWRLRSMIPSRERCHERKKEKNTRLKSECASTRGLMIIKASPHVSNRLHNLPWRQNDILSGRESWKFG